MDDSPFHPSPSDSNTPFSDLLVAVFDSILEVIILCLSGYVLARRGLLDKRTQKQLNRLNVTLFTPALLFSKVAFFLSPAKLKELWIIPIWFVIVTVASMAVGRVLAALFHLRRSQRSFIMAAAMFMNSNSLPIALMQSLVKSVPDLAWEKTDNPDAMIGRALTYLSMYSTLGMVLRYSYGVNLLARSDSVNAPTSNGSESDESEEIDERTPLLLPSSKIAGAADLPPSPTFGTQLPPHSRAASPSRKSHGFASNLAESNALTKPQPRFRREGPFYNSFPNTPRDSTLTLARYDSRMEGDSDHPLPLPTSCPDGGGGVVHQPTGIRRIRKSFNRIWTSIKNFMTAPLWAALVSLVVAFIEPLKHALEHHMLSVKGAINAAGKCSIPITLVVLGAYFYDPPEDGVATPKTLTVKTNDEEGGSRTFLQRLFGVRSLEITTTTTTTTTIGLVEKQKRPGETKTVVLAVLARMVITPILLVPLLLLAARFNGQEVFEDPVFVTVNTILLCSPPALTLAQITAAVSGDAFERLISRTIFWSYCFATPPVTIGCVLLGLWLSKM